MTYIDGISEIDIISFIVNAISSLLSTNNMQIHCRGKRRIINAEGTIKPFHSLPILELSTRKLKFQQSETERNQSKEMVSQMRELFK